MNYWRQRQLGIEVVVEGFQDLEKGFVDTGWEGEIALHHLPAVGGIVDLIDRFDDHTQIAACTFDGPEQIGILSRRSSVVTSIGNDHVNR